MDRIAEIERRIEVIENLLAIEKPKRAIYNGLMLTVEEKAAVVDAEKAADDDNPAEGKTA